MIYEVNIDGKPLYYPGDDEFVIYNSELDMALNDSGTFKFDIPVINPMYDEFECRKSMIQILKDKKEIFCGEVRKIGEEFDKIKPIQVVGELSFLFDSIQPQARYQDITPAELFTKMIEIHNSQVEERKRFKVGIVTVKDSNDSLYRYTNHEETLTAIREKLCDKLNGYLRIRKVDGVRYIDLVTLSDYGKTCNQPIQFGVNLLDYASETSAENLATAVIPLGAKLETQVVEGLDAYTTIESVNDGLDYVYNQEAVDRYGWIKVVKKWPDVTVPANLKKKAEEWLNENRFENLSLDLDAIDLSMLNCNIESYDVGDMVNALAEPFNLNVYLPVQKKKFYLQDLKKNKILLSNTMSKSYTSQVNDTTTSLENNEVQTSTVLEAAKKQSAAIINASNEGNVYKVLDENGNAKELLIMDTMDLNTARKLWRWNLNGFGYSKEGYNPEKFEVAITMDGAIVADFITVGTMLFDRLLGGTLKLGGKNNGNGVLVVYDENGAEKGRWDKDGITLPEGTKIAWSDITGAETVLTKDKLKTESLEASNLKITGGSINIEAGDGTSSFMLLKHSLANLEIYPYKVVVTSKDGTMQTGINYAHLYNRYLENGKQVEAKVGNGAFRCSYDGVETLRIFGRSDGYTVYAADEGHEFKGYIIADWNKDIQLWDSNNNKIYSLKKLIQNAEAAGISCAL